jgi:hypothetical protein
MGMGFVLQVGNLTDMPNTPYDFPRCGNWVESTEIPSGAASGSHVGTIMLVLLSWFLLSVANCGV